MRAFRDGFRRESRVHGPGRAERMGKRSLFGAHLYNQIVYPLLAASVVVGIIATLVAVYFLEDLTDRSVSRFAESFTGTLAGRYRDSAEQMLREAQFASRQLGLADEIERGGNTGLQGVIENQNESFEFNMVAIIDSAGRVVVSTGDLAVRPGTAPFGGLTSKTISRPRVIIDRLSGKYAMTALHPIPGTGYALTLSRRVDDAFLAGLGVGDLTAFALYDSDMKAIACAGAGFDKMTDARIDAALTKPVPEVLDALSETTPYDPGAKSVDVAGGTYQVWAIRLNLPGGVGERSTAYLVGVVSQLVTEDTIRTTRSLIAMWSVVAVVALVGLGGWIARRVSDPLVALSAGARRIADGDFSTKVKVEGGNEVAELAETFNEMTISLRERSDSLTKKVLELATLYEMSRALGSTLDMEELLGSVLESALRIFDVDTGYVVLRERETGELGIRALRGAEPAGDRDAVGSSMSEWVVREGRPLIFNPDAATQRGQVDSVTGARAALCVPLISPEGTIGSITIGSSRGDYRFSSDDVRLLSTIANHVTIAVGNIELFSSLQEAYLATVKSLAAAVDAKDTYTRGHSDRVATYATLTAERMGLSHEQRIALEMAAYLHDIGKIGVPGDILLKPGRLDDAEMAQMRHHPLIGANILKPVAFPWAITPVVRHHHEAFDGSGYPAGLKGEEIPLLARILTVADSFEAMTADRPYRKGRSVQEAVDELRRCSGGQFDPRIVEVFIETIRELEQDEPGFVGGVADEVAPEEARAIFAALVDGLFVSFRRLGGPRLASNVEAEADEYFVTEEMPFRVVRGRLSFVSEVPDVFNGELEQMRSALRRIDAAMGRVSGVTLVEHFYSDALDGLSARMRHLAQSLEFLEAS